MTKKNTLFITQPLIYIYNDYVASIGMHTLIRYMVQLCQCNVDVLDVDIRHMPKKLADLRNAMLEPTMSHKPHHVLALSLYRPMFNMAGSSS